jgi:hypothetical protein
MAENESNINLETVDEKFKVPQFYIQLFSEWKSNEEPYERMMKDILLDHFLPDEID